MSIPCRNDRRTAWPVVQEAAEETPAPVRAIVISPAKPCVRRRNRTRFAATQSGALRHPERSVSRCATAAPPHGTDRPRSTEVTHPMPQICARATFATSPQNRNCWPAITYDFEGRKSSATCYIRAHISDPDNSSLSNEPATREQHARNVSPHRPPRCAFVTTIAQRRQIFL